MHKCIACLHMSRLTNIDPRPSFRLPQWCLLTDLCTPIDCFQTAYDESRGVQRGAPGRALPGPDPRPREFAPILRLYSARCSEVHGCVAICKQTQNR